MTARMFHHALGAVSLLLLLRPSAIADDGSLVQRFADPPAQARILKIIHNWPDASPAQNELIRQLTRQGFGGVVCNVSFDDYLVSEAKWRSFQHAVVEAKMAGWALWLYDERGYPSGNAGGIVLRGHPEWEASGLLIADAATEGPSISLAAPPGELVLATAFPVRGKSIDRSGKIDLSRQVRDGRIEWQPAGTTGGWHVLVVTRNRLFEGTHCETNYSAKIPYPNLLMPEPTRRFLEVTHERYAERLGSDLGSRFMATFTDEPSLMSVFMKPMPYRVLPWAPALPAEFQRRRGYPIEPIIPDLVLDGGPAAQRHRYDFWLTISELVSENYFGQIQDWCQRHHLRSGGHLLMEESLVAHVPFYGDFFRCARRLDAPSIDCLTSLPAETPWFIARLVASVAELEGKTVVMCETSDHAQRYRPPGDARPVRDVTEAEIRGTCNRLILGGVNCITSYYSFAGLSDEALGRLNAWVGRCCTMLTGGHQVADIALVYPIQSVWPRFVPSHEWTREAHEAAKVESIYRADMDSLYDARRDFTIADARAITEAAVAKGTMVHGPSQWRVLVLPGVDTLPLAAWENLARFVREGGVLVAQGALPTNSESEFPCPRVLALSREIFGPAAHQPTAFANAAGGGGVFLPAGSESLLPIVLKGVLDPDVNVANAAAPLRVTHRRIDGHEIYFLINDSPRPWRGDVDFAARGPGEQWDPATGRVQPLSAGRPAPLSLDAYGATLLRFAEPPSSARRQLTTGALPGLAVIPLPPTEPTTAHGEFVAVELRREPVSSRSDEPRFDAHARLTRSRVDTHLFVRFHHDPPQSLDTADCLVIDTWAPAGQKTRTEILVILHEQGGGDFIAGTGRSLGVHGHERTFLPLSRFQQAGWSQDPDGVLDRRKISDVSIGWGGYLGAEGEPVRFQVARPQLGRVGGERGH
jgi:hypothetical protein